MLKKIFFWFIPLFLFTVFTLVAYQSYQLPVNIADKQTKSFNISQGETIDSIGIRLKEAGLIRSRKVFKLAVLKLGIAKKIQAGKFKLSPSWDLNKIAVSLTSGRSDIELTIIEGLRREEIADVINRQFVQKGMSFDKQAFLILTQGKEGYLFPDTYFIPQTSSVQEIVDLLLNTFSQKLSSQLKNKLDAKDLTLDQALVFASLVEREARTDNTRPTVAGILIKRWENNWPLQVDATVQYALGYQKNTDSWWKQSLTKEDLNNPSPYNTYLHSGLPPAPICNPSLSSIQAIADYQQSDYWFYLSDESGNMHYAATIAEHNYNVAKYLHK